MPESLSRTLTEAAEPAKPYAYQRWVCSTCDGEPINETNGDADLRCETCGHLFRSSIGGYAKYVPDPDEEDDDVE